MQRKDFLKNGIAALGVAFVAPLLTACKKETDVAGTAATTTCSGSTQAPALLRVRAQ